MLRRPACSPRRRERALRARARARAAASASRAGASTSAATRPSSSGRGRSRARGRGARRGRVYLDHLLRLLAPLHADGCEVLFWGDVLRDHPELVPELPRKARSRSPGTTRRRSSEPSLPAPVRALLAELRHDSASAARIREPGAGVRGAGLPFWVCPGTSTWNSLVGRCRNARANLRRRGRGRPRARCGRLPDHRLGRQRSPPAAVR